MHYALAGIDQLQIRSAEWIRLMIGSMTVGDRTRPYPIARAIPPVAEIMNCRATERAMGARGAVIPVPKRRSPDPVGQTTQARRGAGIDVGAPYAVARRAAPVAEGIDVCRAKGLFRSAERIEVVEGRVADVDARAGLRERYRGKEHE